MRRCCCCCCSGKKICVFSPTAHLPSRLFSSAATGSRENFSGMKFPSGRPRWLIRTTDLAPLSRQCLMLGTAALILKKETHPDMFKDVCRNVIFFERMTSCSIVDLFFGRYLWLLVMCLSFIGTLKSTLKEKKTSHYRLHQIRCRQRRS